MSKFFSIALYACALLCVAVVDVHAKAALQSKITLLPEPEKQRTDSVTTSSILHNTLPQQLEQKLEQKLEQQAAAPDLTFVNYFLTDDAQALEAPRSMKVFDCVGTIYAAIRFDSSNHDLRNSIYEVQWFNPDGDLELTSKRPSYVDSGNRAFRFAGMTLSRPQGGGLFSLLDYSAGMERFIGDWRAKIWIGGEFIKTMSFSVEC